jgi:hypothetical protein
VLVFDCSGGAEGCASLVPRNVGRPIFSFVGQVQKSDDTLLAEMWATAAQTKAHPPRREGWATPNYFLQVSLTI